MISTLKPMRSPYLMYMRIRSPANKADSSPPVPARISTNALRSSSGSLGNNKRCSSSSSRSKSACASLTSSLAISCMSRMSLSLSISCASAKSFSRFKNKANSEATRLTSACSLFSARYFFMSSVMPSCCKKKLSSPKRMG